MRSRLLTPVVPLVVVGLLVALLVAGCGGGDEEASGSGPAALDGLSATQACTEVLNARDAEVVSRGTDTSFDLVLAVLGSEEPDAATKERWREEMTAARDQLAADRAMLADVSSGPAWEAVLASIDEKVEVLDVRIAATEGAWPTEHEEVADTSLGIDRDVLAEDGLAGRDCEVVATADGAGGADTFVGRLATACSGIVDRRGTELRSAEEIYLNEVTLPVTQDEDVEITPEIVEAVEFAGAEWARTRDDLVAVGGDGAADAAAWEAVLQYASDRADQMDRRAAALRGGDQDAVREAFGRESIIGTGFAWEPLGVALRDCRSIVG